MHPKLNLKMRDEKRIKSGHLWIFSNEIEMIDGHLENGDLVSVYDFMDNFMGTGFYNRNSLISVRMLSKDDIEDFYPYARERLLAAYHLRKFLYPERTSFRMLFSESDFMPGLIIDKYNSTFVLQAYSYGMDKNIPVITKILQEDFDAKNIFTRNDPHFRKLEGLSENDSILLGIKEEEIINDGAINYRVDFNKGQKTGFFFDQSDNRFFIERICSSKNILDAFCNSGGFGLHALRGGASSVTFLDSSEFEIENAKYNCELNQFNGSIDFVKMDAFDYFKECLTNEKKFDIVVADPPSFAKSRKLLPIAKKGYEKLNKLVVQLVNPGGFLITSSCSHHLNKDEFIEIVNIAAAKMQKKVQMLYFNTASLDHPQLPAMPETSYLKFAVFKVE